MGAFRRDYRERDKIFSCKTCEKRFVTKGTLNHHIAISHKSELYRYRTKKKLNAKAESDEKYCKLCYIVYKDSRFLKRHKKKVHSYEMEAFSRDLSLEELSYSCAKCKKSFFSRNTLDHHDRRKHNKAQVENYCRLCHVTFARSDTFKNHIEGKHKNGSSLFF